MCISELQQAGSCRRDLPQSEPITRYATQCPLIIIVGSCVPLQLLRSRLAAARRSPFLFAAAYLLHHFSPLYTNFENWTLFITENYKFSLELKFARKGITLIGKFYGLNPSFFFLSP